MTTTTATVDTFPTRRGHCPEGCATPGVGDLVRYHGSLTDHHGVYRVRSPRMFHRFDLVRVDPATGRAVGPWLRKVRLASISPFAALTWARRDGRYESSTGHVVRRDGRRWLVEHPSAGVAAVAFPTLHEAKAHVAHNPEPVDVCPHRWVDDGRDARAVRSRDVREGDVLLGWNGEPWDLGTVTSVAWVDSVIGRHRVITTDAGASYGDDGTGWRRVAR